jgi:DNA polymerase-3 subunit delta
MIVTLTGENSFGLHRDLQKLVTAFVAEQGDMALERIDGQEATFERMREAITSLPFLADTKMVVLRAPSANKQFLESYESLFADAYESTQVLIVEPKLDKRTAYYKYLKTKTDFTEYGELDAIGLARWLTENAKAQGGTISAGDARYLIERVGVSQQLVSNELDKLLLYNPSVTRQTIKLLTEATPQSTIFELLEAAFGGRLKQAMQLYAEQRALKVEPQQIIAMLAWQLHVLAVIKAAGDRSPETIAKDAKMSPYVVRKSQGIARKLSLAQLKTLVADLLVIDTRSKRTMLDLDEALQHYLVKLAN